MAAAGPLPMCRVCFPHESMAMFRQFATCALMLGGALCDFTANADPAVCVGALTDVEILFHVKQDSYFVRKPLDGKSLRIEYDGCGYRVHVGESSSRSRDGDLLLVDRFGKVTKVIHLR